MDPLWTALKCDLLEAFSALVEVIEPSKERLAALLMKKLDATALGALLDAGADPADLPEDDRYSFVCKACALGMDDVVSGLAADKAFIVRARPKLTHHLNLLLGGPPSRVQGHLPTIERLLQCGASVAVADKRNGTPLEQIALLIRSSKKDGRHSDKAMEKLTAIETLLLKHA